MNEMRILANQMKAEACFFKMVRFGSTFSYDKQFEYSDYKHFISVYSPDIECMTCTKTSEQLLEFYVLKTGYVICISATKKWYNSARTKLSSITSYVLFFIPANMLQDSWKIDAYFFLSLEMDA